MRKAILFIILLPRISLYPQENLIMNSDFEEYDDLPSNETPDGVSYAKYWYVPNDCSPEYYHSNCSFSNYQVPNNKYGYHPAYSGNAYIGLCPFKWDGYMEHLSGTLKEPLLKGNTSLLFLSGMLVVPVGLV